MVNFDSKDIFLFQINKLIGMTLEIFYRKMDKSQLQSTYKKRVALTLSILTTQSTISKNNRFDAAGWAFASHQAMIKAEVCGNLIISSWMLIPVLW